MTDSGHRHIDNQVHGNLDETPNHDTLIHDTSSGDSPARNIGQSRNAGFQGPSRVVRRSDIIHDSPPSLQFPQIPFAARLRYIETSLAHLTRSVTELKSMSKRLDESHCPRLPLLQFTGPADASQPVHETWKLRPGYESPLTTKAMLLLVFRDCAPSYEHMVRTVAGWATSVPNFTGFRQIERFPKNVLILDQLTSIQSALIQNRIPYHKWSRLSLALLSEDIKPIATDVLETTIYGMNWFTLCRHLATPSAIVQFYETGTSEFFTLVPHSGEKITDFLNRLDAHLDRYSMPRRSDLVVRQIHKMLTTYYWPHRRSTHQCGNNNKHDSRKGDSTSTSESSEDNPVDSASKTTLSSGATVASSATQTPQDGSSKPLYIFCVYFQNRKYLSNSAALERVESAYQSGDKLIAYFSRNLMVDFEPLTEDTEYHRAKNYLTLDSEAFPTVFHCQSSIVNFACEQIENSLSPYYMTCIIDVRPIASIDHLTPVQPPAGFIF